MRFGSHLDLGIDPDTIRSYEDYKAGWKKKARALSTPLGG